ncbi:MAG: GYD domain-containing protein [candidate division Zixibacteria bacterium]|nr:GYD domain-containing protein [candidate division Zixibacteria bacterium]
MKTFVLMTKMAARDADIMEVATKLKARVRREAEWVQAVKKACPDVQFLAHYALLGQWDFMDIYEAPDEEAAAVVSLLSRAHGAHQVESWVAIPNSRLLAIAEAFDPDPDEGVATDAPD